MHFRPEALDPWTLADVCVSVSLPPSLPPSLSLSLPPARRRGSRLRVTPPLLYPTPYTLRPTPYALRPTPYTLAPYTLHPSAPLLALSAYARAMRCAEVRRDRLFRGRWPGTSYAMLLRTCVLCSYAGLMDAILARILCYALMLSYAPKIDGQYQLCYAPMDVNPAQY
eukprot:1744278-Rhodomonas_salina.1